MSAYNSKQRHRLSGIVLILPFIAWSLTGIFFLVRPGYEQAYERVPVKQYPSEANIALEVNPDWQEVRFFRTILGDHLLVLSDDGWQHLERHSKDIWALPAAAELTKLLEDAFQFNAQRYGNVVSLAGNQATTDTGVELTVDWQTLSIRQNGRDSRWIDRIYRAHYLQWTGIGWLDSIVGVAGLILLLYMSISGWGMAFGKSRKQ